MWKLRKRKSFLSQNFLHDPRLVARLIRSSTIGKNDTVLEIGPGKGIITKELLRVARNVLSIELDKTLCDYLLNVFEGAQNLILYDGNFLDTTLPLTPYKVFANLPFAIEGMAVRKLIDAENPPDDSLLVLRKELAFRLGGIERESMFSIMHKPWFDFSIVYSFNRHDFIPSTKVPAVMLRFRKRTESLIPLSDKDTFQQFVVTGFGDGLSVIWNLRKRFSKDQIATGARKANVSKQQKPADLSLEQWINLYLALH